MKHLWCKLSAREKQVEGMIGCHSVYTNGVLPCPPPVPSLHDKSFVLVFTAAVVIDSVLRTF